MYYGREIAFPKDNAVFGLVHGDDFENADPEEKLREQFFFTRIGIRRKNAYMQIHPALAQRMTSNDEKNIMMHVFKLANQDATDEINRIKSVVLPGELLSIFEGLKKKQEEKLFETLLLTPEMFMALLIHAGSNHGYRYSFYTFAHNPTGTNISDVPRFAYKEEGSEKIYLTDDSPLTEGQIRSLIDQRGTTVVKFLDKGSMWHCFFLTIRGHAGKEKDHPPHMHYLSNSWGLTREAVLAELKQKTYSIPSVHVWYN